MNKKKFETEAEAEAFAEYLADLSSAYEIEVVEETTVTWND